MSVSKIPNYPSFLPSPQPLNSFTGRPRVLKQVAEIGVNDSSWGRAHQYLTHPQSHPWELGFRRLQEGTCTTPSVENVGANAKSQQSWSASLYIKRKNIKRLVCKFSCGQEAFPYFFISLFIFKLRGNYGLVSRILFSNSWNLILVLNPKGGTTLIDSSFMWPSLTPSGVKQPLSPPLFLPVLYFLQMHLLIYPDSSLTKNLIISGLNYLL